MTDAQYQGALPPGVSGGSAANPLAASATYLPLPTGIAATDTAHLNTVLSRGGRIRPNPLAVTASYSLSAPLVVPANTDVDFGGCTFNLTGKFNMLQNSAVTAAATATDVGTTAGSAVVTSATLAAVAHVGQVLAVVGAGPQGGNTADGPNNIWLYGTVQSIAGNNITITSSNVNGIAANTTASGQTGYLFNRDTNIWVSGGIWNGGTTWNTRADRTAAGFNSHQLRFRRVDGLTVRSLTVTLSGFPGGGGWVFGINPGDCTNFLIEGITANASSTAVQCDGPCARGTIRNIYGQTQDDMVALGCVDFQGNDLEGDIADVLVEGVFANGSWTAFKAFAGAGSNGAQRYCIATVRTVKGTTTQGPVNLNDYTGAGTGPIQIAFEDIQASWSGSSSITNSATLGRVASPNQSPAPSLSGLLAWTCDPFDTSWSWAPSSGVIYVAMIPAPSPILVANLLMFVKTAGATLTAAQNLVGLYDPQGQMGPGGGLIAKSADQSAAWTSTGLKTAALTAQGGYSLKLPGGPGVFYWATILSVGTTPPAMAVKSSLGSGAQAMSPQPGYGAPYAASVPGAKHRSGYWNTGGQTALASLNGKTISDSGMAYLPWVGIT